MHKYKEVRGLAISAGCAIMLSTTFKLEVIYGRQG